MVSLGNGFSQETKTTSKLKEKFTQLWFDKKGKIRDIYIVKEILKICFRD